MTARSHLTLDRQWGQKADALFNVFAGPIVMGPTSYAQMLSAFGFAIGPSKEIVIVGATDGDRTSALTKEIYSRFMPDKVVLFYLESEAAVMEKISPYTADQRMVNGRATVYVCENHVCKLPVTDASKLKELLDVPSGGIK